MAQAGKRMKAIREQIERGKAYGIDEALELMTGFPAGEPDGAGNVPAESIFGMVDARLAELAEVLSASSPEGGGR